MGLLLLSEALLAKQITFTNLFVIFRNKYYFQKSGLMLIIQTSLAQTENI